MDGRKIAALIATDFLGALLVGTSVTPVDGQPSREPITVEAYQRTVFYNDLALNTQHGKHLLIKRVAKAVREVCPYYDERGFSYDVMDCRDFAWAGAQPQIKQALEEARTGQSLSMSIVVSSAGSR